MKDQKYLRRYLGDHHNSRHFHATRTWVKISQVGHFKIDGLSFLRLNAVFDQFGGKNGPSKIFL